ncbi:MAG: hypothetical protein M1393_08145 [Candidatus Thermoplasmatota archaeon]|nr:hypothetical protein [Candidatus Thermoplasmatota archaeon]
MQAPGITFSLEERKKLAVHIKKTGIRQVVVSYPSSHRSELEFAEWLVSQKHFDTVYALGRSTLTDVKIIEESGADIYLHLPFDLHLDEEINVTLKYASNIDKRLRISIPRAFDLPDETLKKTLLFLNHFVLDSVVIADTTGFSTPKKTGEVIRLAKKVLESNISVHFHNDRGLALTNSYQSVCEGATSVDVSIFGIGERNGIADMASLEYMLADTEKNPVLDRGEMREAYKYLADLIDAKAGPNFFRNNIPNYGGNSNIHTAGTHASFSDIFRGSEFSVNVYTGSSMIRTILEQNGISIEDHRLRQLVNLIKDKSADEGRSISTGEILAMWSEINENSS